jgi:glycosyltransferase involved in cell wall biosynthesis
MYNILIYTDAPVYGGHEMTLCDAIAGLEEKKEFEITIIIPRINERLGQRLSEIQTNFSVIESDFKTEAGDVFRVLLSTAKVRRLAKVIRPLHPDVIIVSQGAIGLSACGLGAARHLRTKLVSFLPMAHSVPYVRGKHSVDVKLQEFFYRHLYRIPDYFFTVCQSTAAMLQDQYSVSKDKIFVSYYGVDHFEMPVMSYNKKNGNQLSSPKKIGIIGRVEFIQKRHDFFLRALAISDLITKADVFVIGDGPDIENCKALSGALGIGNSVHYTGWVDDVAEWYQKLDAIVMPSRFEGLPLVLIEAMIHGVPVVASKVDGMKEFLPENWLFNLDDSEAMIDKLRTVLFEDQTISVKHTQERAFHQLSLKSYQHAFRENLLKVCANSR